jgi:hypothetical protein
VPDLSSYQDSARFLHTNSCELLLHAVPACMVATVTRNGAPKCCLKSVRNAKNSTMEALLGNSSALRGREFPYLEGLVPNQAIGR